MDLRKNLQDTTELEEKSVKAIIRPIIHEIENSLQVIKLETHLVLRDHAGTLYPAINRIDRLLRDLRDYVLLDEPIFSEQRLDGILDELVDDLKKEFHHKKVKLRIFHKNPIPSLRVDGRQIRKALAHVLRFCQVLIDDAGDVKIGVRLRDMEGRKRVEITITSSSTALLRVREKDVFQPYLRVNNQDVGLGMALAHRVLRGHQASIVFQKKSPKRANVIILMDAGPDRLIPSNKNRTG
ncbi:MAG: hypothetical protein ACREQW_18140, partial [Candidatus Binatia bacterium]